MFNISFDDRSEALNSWAFVCPRQYIRQERLRARHATRNDAEVCNWIVRGATRFAAGKAYEPTS